ncbi:histidine kinase [Microbacterium sp.]|uniref:sensor histidine kinase n=1 Tax=Microbacterium sp. TaxID=51671 RepID=UPI0028B0C6C5|nr:histidine kinase [Microbacterium sp.]
MTTHAATNPWERFGWMMAVVWLVFLVYPVMALLRSDAAPHWISIGWFAIVAFAVLYVVGFIRGMSDGTAVGDAPRSGQWVIFSALIVCALVSVPAEGGSALSFLPFIMSFASYGLTRLWHWITTIASLAVTTATVLLAPNGRSYASVLAIIAMVGVVNTVSTWLIIRSAQAEALGRELATSEGREAVARDVHDLIGHSLTVVRLKAQLARRLIDSDPDRAKAELEAIEELTAEAIAGVRSTVAGARIAALADQLAASREALRAADIEVRVSGEPDVLSPSQALTSGWILREATTNVLRHARASVVNVRIAPGRFEVHDDGVGSGGREGNGVRGMRERAAAAGAAFAVRSDAGTHVEVTW